MAKSKRKSTRTLKSGRPFSRGELSLYIAIFAAVGAFTLWVSLAAPKTNTPGSISIATVNGTPYTSSTSLKLGDTVTFNTISGSMAGWEYPMIDTSCYQDVNGDGTIDTNLLGPDIVFSWLDKPSASLTLGGYSSIWTLRGGGPATCRSNLDAYGWKGGKESVRIMATTGEWQALGK